MSGCKPADPVASPVGRALKDTGPSPLMQVEATKSRHSTGTIRRCTRYQQRRVLPCSPECISDSTPSAGFNRQNVCRVSCCRHAQPPDPLIQARWFSPNCSHPVLYPQAKRPSSHPCTPCGSASSKSPVPRLHSFHHRFCTDRCRSCRVPLLRPA